MKARLGPFAPQTMHVRSGTCLLAGVIYVLQVRGVDYHRLHRDAACRLPARSSKRQFLDIFGEPDDTAVTGAALADVPDVIGQVVKGVASSPTGTGSGSSSTKKSSSGISGSTYSPIPATTGISTSGESVGTSTGCAAATAGCATSAAGCSSSGTVAAGASTLTSSSTTEGTAIGSPTASGASSCTTGAGFGFGAGREASSAACCAASLACSASMAAASTSLMMSIFRPVSLAARRAFWPSFPMARES